MPNPFIVEPLGKHTASIIFAHGLGDSAAGWAPLAQALSRKPQFAHVRWVLPTAPVAPVTANGGYRMTSWFDIQQIDPRAGLKAEDDAGMLASVRTVSQLVSAEVDAGIPSDRVLVGGFSQGAVVSYLAGLTSERKLAGVVALSGWLGMAGKVKAMMTDHATKLPIFHGHGDADPIVEHRFGQQTVDKLRELGCKDVTFKTYSGMQHSLCEEEQEDLEQFIARVLPPN
ncbi:acyl-protein thioesterase 1 [Rhodotorula diobovata]|uniref:Acyl-protein thioesterase 1 n=1 Tax=Rhodotorula diobovata TaxID=5288 RepID=A0A5C5G2T6_9BASI|nr:acyl-protein thioesterase 1 [Rhodotorula diobovata]